MDKFNGKISLGKKQKHYNMDSLYGPYTLFPYNFDIKDRNSTLK